MDATRLAARLLEPIPANRTFAIELLSAIDASAEVALVVASEFHNVIGSLHSSGLIALVDAAGLAAIIAAAAEEHELHDVTPLGSVAHLEFPSPAYARLVDSCKLTEHARRDLRVLLEGKARKAQLDTAADVIDADNVVVCRGTFTWKLHGGS